MDKYMELLRANRASEDNLWTSFCNSKTLSVKMISRNGINTSRTTNSDILPQPTNKLVCFSDNQVNNFVTEATDEVLRNSNKLPDVLCKSGNCRNLNCKCTKKKKTPKVITLKLSPVDVDLETPESSKEIRDLPQNDVLSHNEEMDINSVHESINQTEGDQIDNPNKIETENAETINDPVMIEFFNDQAEKDKVESISEKIQLDFLVKLIELLNKIILNLEEIKSSLKLNQECDEVEMVKQRKLSLAFGIRFSRNHLYHLGRLIEDIRFSDTIKDNKIKVFSLVNSILQATIAYTKGTSTFSSLHSSEKLQELLNHIISAMKINKYDDPDVKNQAEKVTDLCMDINEDLGKLNHVNNETPQKKLPVSKTKKKGVPAMVNIKSSTKQNKNFSMYTMKNDQSPKSRRPKIQNKKPRKTSGSKPGSKNSNKSGETLKVDIDVTDKNGEEKPVNNLHLNKSVEEALLDILREMTKQQMQEIVRPVFNDIELLLKNKVIFM